MNEQRFVLTDQVWQRLEARLPGKSTDAGGTARDIHCLRRVVMRCHPVAIPITLRRAVATGA